MTQFERMFYWMKKPWVMAIYFALVVASYFLIDQPLANFFYQLDTRIFVHGLNILTTFGKWKIYVLLFLITALFFRYVNKNAVGEAASWYLLACVVAPNLLGFVLKIVLSRARPELLFNSHHFGFYWFKLKDLYWSFPSGHSLTIIGLVSGLGVLFPQYFYAMLALAMLVVLSRVGLYYHYLSDVMTGSYLSLLIVGFMTEYLKQNHYLDKLSKLINPKKPHSAQQSAIKL